MPTTTRVKLKRVFALRAGELIVPGLGLFTRTGERITSQAEMSATWGRDPWSVVAPDRESLLELSVGLAMRLGPATDVLHTPMDAYVVLA